MLLCPKRSLHCCSLIFAALPRLPFTGIHAQKRKVCILQRQGGHSLLRLAMRRNLQKRLQMRPKLYFRCVLVTSRL